MPTKHSKKPSDKRPAPVSYRPPADLAEEFARRVETSGLSTSAYITKAVFGADAPRAARRQPLDMKELARLYPEAVKISRALESIAAHQPDDSQVAELLEQACSDLAIFRAAFIAAMGRGP